jgi:hypothetical protein
MVMEYLEGETALNLLRRAKRNKEAIHPVIAGHIVAKAAAGLHAAHELRDEKGELVRLVHRDVSPHNIFVTYGGAVKVLDFGIAKHDERDTATEAGQLKGKFPYMSPEQCLGKEVDRRSDIFSLGIVLFELITGKRLFARETTLMTMQAIVNGEVLSPTDITPDCPPNLAAVCLRALQRDPQQRYQTAADMRRDIMNALRTVQFDDIPEEALAAQMHFLFRDRVHEKQKMLERVGAGSQITNVPQADIDNSVSLPGVDGDRKRVDNSTPFSVESESRATGTWGRGFPLIVAAAILLGVGVGLGVAFGGGVSSEDSTAAAANDGDEDETATPTTDPPAGEETPVVEPPEPEPAAPEEPTEVTLTISSTPTGASVVIDGEERGTTPLELTLPRADVPLAIELSRTGFLPDSRSFVPEADGEIEATLRARPTPRRRRGTRMTSHMERETDAPAMGSPFRRFN